ncbi:MAG: proline--tRNA ligase [Candidatus Woesearchaeota archaeon]|jgi:prolyl-tRNA synthetase|nr:proline--tRNA ligase [Candidatus Woesearchaeota archaeon]MDP7244111.1 proline--tRNA ligase [Flavobacteriales bacterium]|tara:strand:- start:1242 stop:2678 length:1437 start_codon:yes stop_codon:yes gene_type:complete
MPKKEEKLGISVKKEDDFSEWYNEVVIKSELAEHSVIKGFMVIRPRGYAIWECIQDYFDEKIKNLGVKNAYFPLLVPEAFFKKEAEHAQGFEPELAWISEKEEGVRYAIRPTSETIMYDSYGKWVRSWRDLPLRINQWCNILRWEVKQTKLFLRTREFLWQEGHCVYETEEECNKEALLYLNEYKKLSEDLLAIPVLAGKKTEKEKFAGAKTTYSLEALMPDGKALQMGTSHNLGQNFAKAFNIRYLGKDEKEYVPWQNSWGFSTRLIGALVMTHSDDKGLILPPNIASTQIVIVPIYKSENKDKVIKKANEIKNKLKNYDAILDDRDSYTPGWKFNEWELKGIPLRIEIGPKDIAKNQVVLVSRDNNNKEFIKIAQLDKKVKDTLENIQANLFQKAKKFLDSNITEAKDWNDFIKKIKNRKLVKAFFCGDVGCEDLIKDKTQGATSRLIPLEQPKKIGKCVHCRKQGKFLVYFAKAY